MLRVCLKAPLLIPKWQRSPKKIRYCLQKSRLNIESISEIKHRKAPWLKYLVKIPAIKIWVNKSVAKAKKNDFPFKHSSKFCWVWRSWCPARRNGPYAFLMTLQVLQASSNNPPQATPNPSNAWIPRPQRPQRPPPNPPLQACRQPPKTP